MLSQAAIRRRWRAAGRTSLSAGLLLEQGSGGSSRGEAVKLTREQRSARFAGDHPRIVFPGDKPCPATVGEVVRLSRQVEIVILSVTETKAGDWRINYLFRDQRARMMGHVPPIHDARREAEIGPLGPEELRRAARESSTTHSEAEAVPGDGGERVEERHEVAFAMEGLQRDLAREADSKRTVGIVAELERVRAECRRLGVDTTRLDASIKKRHPCLERRLADAA